MEFPKTEQEMFDRVAEHLLTQNKKASVEDYGSVSCRYRVFDNETGECLKCAIGCLIPDDKYSARDEGYSAASVLSRLFGVPGRSRMSELASDLQKVHDLYDVEWWPQELRAKAGYYGLSTAVLDARGV